MFSFKWKKFINELNNLFPEDNAIILYFVTDINWTLSLNLHVRRLLHNKLSPLKEKCSYEIILVFQLHTNCYERTFACYALRTLPVKMPRSFLVKKVKYPVERWAYREPSSPTEADSAPQCPPSPPPHCVTVRYTNSKYTLIHIIVLFSEVCIMKLF